VVRGCFERLNRISPNAGFIPKWSEQPLLKSYQKEKPPWAGRAPRIRFCPKWMPEIRKQIWTASWPHEVLLNEKVGEIKADHLSARQILDGEGLRPARAL